MMSKRKLDYLGVNLSDPNDEFIFCSPISWHPSCKKVMWNECERWDKGPRHRISVAELLDYVPGETPEIMPVPQEIPYAFKPPQVRCPRNSAWPAITAAMP